jgi:hypothetical protein
MSGACGDARHVARRLREWDFRKSSGSRMGNSLVAKWKAAGEGEGAS